MINLEQSFNHKFRKIFITEPVHPVGILSKYTNEIVFLSTGNEKIESLESIISNALKSFNPDEDAIVPMGRVSSCIITGIALANLFRNGEIFMIGLFKDNDYVFIHVGSE